MRRQLVRHDRWDYHLHANEFNVSVDQVERATALINSPALLRWNSNKRYLLDLAKRHVRVLPCLVVRPGAEVPWRDLELAGWRDLVVKPLVGASAWQLMEAELIEPELFFHLVPEAADTFAQAILRHAK